MLLPLAILASFLRAGLEREGQGQAGYGGTCFPFVGTAVLESHWFLISRASSPPRSIMSPHCPRLGLKFQVRPMSPGLGSAFRGEDASSPDFWAVLQFHFLSLRHTWAVSIEMAVSLPACLSQGHK